MLYPSINKIRKKVDSRYTLVILAAQRARDLVDGKPVLTESETERPVSIAANEIAEELIMPKSEMEEAEETGEVEDTEEKTMQEDIFD